MNANVLNVPGILANYDFATMSAYLPGEIDIYERTIATTRPDLTAQNTLSMIGTADVVFFDQPVSDSVAQSMSPVAATSENVTTTPVEITPEMAEALTAAIGGATPGSEAQRNEALSNTKLQELVEEFSAILPPNLSAADLQARKAQFEQNMQRLFAQAQTNPDALPGSYAKWATRGNKRVLTYFSSQGKVDLAQADTGLLSEQTEWWVEFAVTLIMGIIDVFFELNLATAAVKLTKFLFEEVALIGTIAILFSAGVHAVAILGTLDYCYKTGYLKQMVLIVIEEIGWWALAKFCAKILGWLVPGLGEAEMVASLGVLMIRLTILITTYPG